MCFCTCVHVSKDAYYCFLLSFYFRRLLNAPSVSKSNEFKLIAVIENFMFVFSWFSFGKLPRIITLNTFSLVFRYCWKRGALCLQSTDDNLLNGWASVENNSFYPFYNLRKNNVYVFLKLLPYLFGRNFSPADTDADRSCPHAFNS